MDRRAFFYETKTVWAGRRRGVLKAGGLPPIDASSPPEFNGESGFWSPEQLLVASAESCLMATFIAIAEMSKLEVRSYRSAARAKLEPSNGQRFAFTELAICPVIEVGCEQDRERAERLLEKAKRHCFVSNALSIPVQVEARILTGPEPSSAEPELGFEAA